MKKTILFVCTMDTKHVEINYASNIAKENGCNVLILDTSTKDIHKNAGDIGPLEILLNDNVDIEAYEALEDKGLKIEMMARAVINYTKKLYKENRYDGIMSIGGGQNSRMASNAMKELPLGIPKIIVSTLASGKRNFEMYMGSKDILVMHSVVDIAGLNSVTKMVINNAVSAMIGMVNTSIGLEYEKNKPRIAATMLGITTKGTEPIIRSLESQENEVITFHANGVGGVGMEKLIKDDYFDLILDINLHEITCEFLGGFCAGAYKRLEDACKRGVPQIVAPGAVDVLDFAVTLETRDAILKSVENRQYYFHNAEILHSKITREEALMLAEIIAKRLNEATGEIKVILPLRGFCEAGAEGKVLYNPMVDTAFLNQLRGSLSKDIEVIELDCNINDELFTTTVLNLANEIINAKKKDEVQACS